MSAWKEFKKKYEKTPLGLLHPDNRCSDEVAKQRMDTCLSCDYLIKPTNQCQKCGCFMKLKTTLKGSECPVGKWTKV